MFASEYGRSKTPPKKTSFQRELEEKMKERKKKGLSIDLSDTNDSEDELGSDDGWYIA